MSECFALHVGNCLDVLRGMETASVGTGELAPPGPLAAASLATRAPRRVRKGAS